VPLPEPYPDLASLDLLVSVGQFGSISAAARAHGITQPAASMRLRALERVLKVPLLERPTTGARLTPAGLATVEWAAAVLAGMRALLAGTTALRADRDSHLRLAASLTVAEYLLPRWLEQFAVAMPQVKVSLSMGNTGHVIELVAGSEVDLGFVEGPRPPGYLRSRRVTRDELLVVVGAGHPWTRRRKPLTPGELAATPIVLREPGSGTREVLTEALGALGYTVTAAMELASTTAIKAAVMTGAGPAVISGLAVAGELQAGRLAAIPCEGLGLQRAIRAVWAPQRPPSASAARFLAIAAGRKPDQVTESR
jgi:molybdate transport repressor ModE-like protein